MLWFCLRGAAAGWLASFVLAVLVLLILIVYVVCLLLSGCGKARHLGAAAPGLCQLECANIAGQMSSQNGLLPLGLVPEKARRKPSVLEGNYIVLRGPTCRNDIVIQAVSCWKTVLLNIPPVHFYWKDDISDKQAGHKWECVKMGSLKIGSFPFSIPKIQTERIPPKNRLGSFLRK